MNVDRLKILAKILIWMGVLAWVPYMYLKYILDQHVSIFYFLPFHLTGVLGGGGLKLYLRKLKKPAV